MLPGLTYVVAVELLHFSRVVHGAAVSAVGARQAPIRDAVSHLVHVIRGDDVQNTIVNGQMLMRDRRC